jgi:hypothetical protein
MLMMLLKMMRRMSMMSLHLTATTKSKKKLFTQDSILLQKMDYCKRERGRKKDERRKEKASERFICGWCEY